MNEHGPSERPALAQLSLTDAGQARYAALRTMLRTTLRAQQQQSAMPVPPTEFGAQTGIPADCRSSATPRSRHRG